MSSIGHEIELSLLIEVCETVMFLPEPSQKLVCRDSGFSDESW